MKKIKVGFLPLYTKLYDDFSGPHLRAPMEAYMAECVKELEGKNISVVLADVCRIAPEFEAAADRFNAENVDAVITMHLAYSPSLESIGAFLKMEAPIVIFDTTPHYELLKVQATENRIFPNHGIHGVQDLCNLLKRNGKTYDLCVGHLSQPGLMDRLAGCCRAAAVKKAYSTMRIGTAGGNFAGMGDFLVSDEDYKTAIGAQVVSLTPDVANVYLSQVTPEEIRAEQKKDAQKYRVEVKNQENYDLATKAGLAMRKWMEAENLGAVTVNFSTVSTSGLPKMPFAECCKVLERNQGYAGEGDVLTAGLVGALATVYPKTTFTEMFCPDWEQDVILLSHYAESNPKLSQWKPRLLDVGMHYDPTGNTVGIYSCAEEGDACIVNLAPMEEVFALILCPGKLLNVGMENSAYSRDTQGWFQPRKPLPQFLREYSLAGGTHHSAMVYDVDIEELKTFGRMMGFQVVVIEK